jgi:hypothetical protein
MKWIIIIICAVVLILLILFILGVIGMTQVLKGAYCMDRAILRGLRYDKTVDYGGVKSRKAQR